MQDFGVLVEETNWIKENKIFRFAHYAMATLYEIYIYYENYSYAEQAAQAAFLELDRFEQELSRYIQNSDISRINNLKQDESIIVGLDAFACLRSCFNLYRDTGKAFDISAGPLIDYWRNKQQYEKRVSQTEIIRLKNKIGLSNIELDETLYKVRLKGESINIDLGGFGKGYAIDIIANLLADWDIEMALINGGQSTILALKEPPGQKGWPVTISHPANMSIQINKFFLQSQALSGSGIKKGLHIIDPRTGYPIKDKIAAWVGASQASTADALSTAFMIMSDASIEKYINSNKGIWAYIIPKEDNSIIRYGMVK